MDSCFKVGLPTLLLGKLLAQYFEKRNIYWDVHIPPQTFLSEASRFFAFNCQNPGKINRSRLCSTSKHSYGSQNNFNLGIH